MAQNEYVAYHNRKHLTAFAACIVFVVVTFVVMLGVVVRQQQLMGMGVGTFVIILLAVGEIYCVYALIKVLRALASKQPVLIINQEGILDNVNVMGASGLTRWSDIAQFEVKGSGASRTLYITPYDRAALLRSKPLGTRVHMRMFRPDAGGGAFKIETRGLAVTADAIRAEMRRYRPDLCI